MFEASIRLPNGTVNVPIEPFVGGKPMDRHYYVYIMASKKNGTLYIGVTNNLPRRVYEHRNDTIEGFTRKYGVRKLVYYEQMGDVHCAIEREKAVKKWNRQWKIDLIERFNPCWDDLYDNLGV